MKDRESGFFVEELEVDFPRRTDASVLEVVFESGFCCFIEKQFWLLRDFSGGCGCFSLNYSFGCHAQTVKTEGLRTSEENWLFDLGFEDPFLKAKRDGLQDLIGDASEA
ncbi:uncharacterized protein G2W53_014438 [Senna tora]|uniref:Uncharacterized protein n=1 Tax=Senna tora TaxID=362788 RepID=A0A834WTI3_9FABA|nr:uncharacterized protein G2W53_014438 [Senna tora]